GPVVRRDRHVADPRDRGQRFHTLRAAALFVQSELPLEHTARRDQVALPKITPRKLATRCRSGLALASKFSLHHPQPFGAQRNGGGKIARVFKPARNIRERLQHFPRAIAEMPALTIERTTKCFHRAALVAEGK